MRVIESFGIFSRRSYRPKEEGDIWHISVPNPIDGSVRAKLEKLGMDKRNIDELYRQYYSLENDDVNGVSIIIEENNGSQSYNWQFNSFHDIDHDIGYTGTDYTDKGEMTLTIEEEEEWRLREEADKYNV